jgi:hypothetical protein
MEVVRNGEGLVTLASAALGPASSSEEDTNKHLPPPLQLMELVDLQKGLGDEGFSSYTALVNSGTNSFIFQAIADGFSKKAVIAGRTKRKEMPMSNTAANSEALRTTTVVCQIVWMCDSTRTNWSHVTNFVVAYIAYYNMILGMKWL